MKLLQTTCLLFLLAYSPALYADNLFPPRYDSIIQWDFGAGSIYQHQFAFKKDFPTILYPGSLPQRRYYDTSLQKIWHLKDRSLTDNPLLHEAYFLTIGMKAFLTPRLSFRGTVTFEGRGSYGVYNFENMPFFPQFRISYADSFHLSQRRMLNLSAEIGNFNNIRFDEGLIFYNLDIRGALIRLQAGDWNMELFHADDLFSGIGLGIDDAFSATANYTGLGKNSAWKSRIGLGYTINTVPFLSQVRNIVGVPVAFYRDSLVRYYGQIGYRIDFPGRLEERAAAVAGAELRPENHSRLRLNIFRFEARYYGGVFDKGNIYNEVYYRRFKDAWFDNTVGPNLYPVKNFFRPFSQWAVFTEYRNQNIVGLTGYADVSYGLYRYLSFKTVIDGNLIAPQHRHPFLYPFYQAGIEYAPKKSIEIFAGITNRTMDLDRHYQTFYLLEKPIFQLHLLYNMGIFE